MICINPPPSPEQARVGAFRIHHPSNPTRYILVREKTFYFARQIGAIELGTDAQGLEGWFIPAAELPSHPRAIFVKE
jgi:hypothetical protein